MTPQEAVKVNGKIYDKIKKLQGEILARFRVRVIQRNENGGRSIIEDLTTDYVHSSEQKKYYDDYKAMYSDSKSYFIIIEPVEDIKRKVDIRLPVRTDSDREPAGLPPLKE